jgi:hypothetical protein
MGLASKRNPSHSVEVMLRAAGAAPFWPIKLTAHVSALAKTTAVTKNNKSVVFFI